MRYRSSVIAVAVLLCLSVAASVQDAKKYSAWEGSRSPDQLRKAAVHVLLNARQT